MRKKQPKQRRGNFLLQLQRSCCLCESIKSINRELILEIDFAGMCDLGGYPTVTMTVTKGVFTAPSSVSSQSSPPQLVALVFRSVSPPSPPPPVLLGRKLRGTLSIPLCSLHPTSQGWRAFLTGVEGGSWGRGAWWSGGLTPVASKLSPSSCPPCLSLSPGALPYSGRPSICHPPWWGHPGGETLAGSHPRIL